MKITLLVVSLVAMSSIGWGKVNGVLVEKFGTTANKSHFKDWVKSTNALLTPESTNLALQACLRHSQEQLDGKAYDEVAVNLVKSMQSFNPLNRNIQSKLEQSLGWNARLLVDVQNITAKSAQEYIGKCKDVVKKHLSGPGAATILVAYSGRMYPEDSPKMPAEIKAKLDEMRKNGSALGPLTKDGLIEQACVLEGYYSTSYDSRLWRFFTTTRLLSNILPSRADEAEFRKLVLAVPSLVNHIRTLDIYSSVAGKSNGATISMNRNEEENTRESIPVRITGVAYGSDQTSLMSFFTTAWRENLQDHIVTQKFPKAPFNLISANTVLSSLSKTVEEVKKIELIQRVKSRAVSQTERGMVTALRSTNVAVDAAYGKTAALAWVALNAETNIRQNEKLAGMKETAVIREPEATTNVFASESDYLMIASQATDALGAYKLVDPKGDITNHNCVPSVQAFAKAAAVASKGRDKRVVNVDRSVVKIFMNDFAGFDFKPVIADIGAEVHDPASGLGQTDFRLHLATGEWRAWPVTVDGKTYTVGTPSAFVLHLDKTTSTAVWRQSGVQKYDVK